MRTSRIGKTLATLTAATAVALGGTLVTAPTASAVDGSGCEVNVRNYRAFAESGGATVRNGPGTNYRRKGFLPAGNSFLVRCYAVNSHGNVWFYGDPSPTTYRGWVYAGNIG
ncbi:hypothetical protein AB0B50_16125 [Streptomyces sp. NPDC041068]|uniref:hypothetical protein n=1 Tax=Streptomyces sp. NPDC041068 TaxID=3155130 RepID=UPI0033CE57A8